VDPGQEQTGNVVARLVGQLEGRGYHRPPVAIVLRTSPQQYRLSYTIGGTIRGFKGTYADLTALIARLPELGCG
jgi:hypothetical protein